VQQCPSAAGFPAAALSYPAYAEEAGAIH